MNLKYDFKINIFLTKQTFTDRTQIVLSETTLAENVQIIDKEGIKYNF